MKVAGRNNPGFLVCATQRYTSSLPITALVQEREKQHMSYARQKMVWRHTGKAGFHNGQRVPAPVFMPVPWVPSCKQETIFLADKPWYTP